MKKLTLSIFTIFLLTLTFGQPKLKGTFIGFEEIENWKDSLVKDHPYSDPVNPKHKWFHLSVLTFKDDSVFLEQSPIALYKKVLLVFV